MLSIKDIYQELVFGEKTGEYYESVAGGFIIEAIENTLKDLKIYNHVTKKDIARIHKHITENYI